MAAAGESLDLVDQPAASGAGGVLERLRAREEQRSQEAAKRLEELEVSSDPRESVAAFLASFGSQRQALQERLEAAGALPTGGAGELAAAKAVLEKLASDVAELEKAGSGCTMLAVMLSRGGPAAQSAAMLDVFHGGWAERP